MRWLLLLSSAALIAAAPIDLPPIPYKTEGACPGELCGYGGHIVHAPIQAFVQPDGSPAYTIKKDECVVAETGFILTTKAGVARVVRETGLGRDFTSPTPKAPALKLKAGTLFYPLYSQGEGAYFFWYQGGTYSDFVTFENPDVQQLVAPQYVWWVKVRNSAGQYAWVKDPPFYGYEDKCE